MCLDWDWYLRLSTTFIRNTQMHLLALREVYKLVCLFIIIVKGRLKLIFDFDIVYSLKV